MSEPAVPLATPRLTDYLTRVSRLVADRMGLHFPPERFGDLVRGLTSAAGDSGCADVTEYARTLLSDPLTPHAVQVLASHLTIGETYFFRESSTWDALRDRVLPDLIQARRGHQQRLRVWSAACASGEEAFSLAILLYELLPDFPSWHVTILGTDINPRFLRKAMAGAYSEWSFRGTPREMRDRYFTRTREGRYEIRADFRQLVSFEHVNLVEDAFPSLVTETNAMDLILCRNVLMYFTPGQFDNVVAKLHRSLVDGGWLVVSPSEASHTRFPQFAVANFPGAIFFRKGGTSRQLPKQRRIADPAAGLGMPATCSETRRVPLPPVPREQNLALVDHAVRARELANDGRLGEALASCDQWITSNRLFAPAHYIRAMILLEHGDHDQARQSLQRALYLDPTLVLAHVALGTVARMRGAEDEARRHVANAQTLLAQLPADAILPETDGLTAGRLARTLSGLHPPEPSA